MNSGKSVAMTFRVTPEFKQLLQCAARLEQRSNTNMLEKLLRDHCLKQGLLPGHADGDVAQKTA